MIGTLRGIPARKARTVIANGEAAAIAQRIKTHMIGFQVYPVASQEEVGRLSDALWKLADMMESAARSGVSPAVMETMLAAAAEILEIEGES